MEGVEPKSHGELLQEYRKLKRELSVTERKLEIAESNLKARGGGRDAEKEMQRLREEAEEALADLEKSQNEVMKLKRQGPEAINKTLELRDAEIKKLKEQLKGSTDSDSSSSSKQIAKLQKKVTMLDDECNKLAEELDEQDIVVAELKKENEQLKANKASGGGNERSKTDDSIKTLKTEITELKRSKELIQKEEGKKLKDATGQIEALTKANERLERENKTLKCDLQESKRSTDSSGKLEALSNAKARLEKENNKLKSELEESKKIKDASKKVETLTRANEKLEKDNKKLKSDLDETNKKIDSKNISEASTDAKKIKALEKKIGELERDLDEGDNDLVQSEKTCDELQRKVDELQKKLKEVEAASTMSDRISKLNVNGNKEMELKLLKQNIESLESENYKLRTSIQKSGKADLELQQIKSEYATEKSRFLAEISDLKHEIMELDHCKKTLDQVGRDSAAEKEQHQAQIAMKDEELIRMREESSRRNVNILKLKGNLETADAHLAFMDERCKNLCSERDQFLETLKLSRSETNQLREDLARMKKELTDKNNTIWNLESQLKSGLHERLRAVSNHTKPCASKPNNSHPWLAPHYTTTPPHVAQIRPHSRSESLYLKHITNALEEKKRLQQELAAFKRDLRAQETELQLVQKDEEINGLPECNENEDSYLSDEQGLDTSIRQKCQKGVRDIISSGSVIQEQLQHMSSELGILKREIVELRHSDVLSSTSLSLNQRDSGKEKRDDEPCTGTYSKGMNSSTSLLNDSHPRGP